MWKMEERLSNVRMLFLCLPHLGSDDLEGAIGGTGDFVNTIEKHSLLSMQHHQQSLV
jgi:hypothetical protein